MSSFMNKVVIVTGGAQGIGMALSRTYAQAGAYVIMADIDEEAGLENLRYILDQGHSCDFIPTDVSSEASVKNLMTLVGEKYGHIDILINNAALPFSKSIEERSLDEWNHVIAVNLTGPYLCTKYALPYMKNRGASILNMASTRAFMSEPDTEPYSASKGGILALTHSLAISLGKYDIRVNAISPGWIDVSAWGKKSERKQAYLSPEDHQQHPVGRVGKPEDVAKACMFLTSPDAGFITGTNLVVDGGMSVKMIYVPDGEH